MRTFTIKERLFKTQPLFVVGCSHQVLDAHLRRAFKCDAGFDAGQSGQMFTFQQSPWRVVWVKKFPHNAKTFGTLMHETFHLVTRICQDKGVPIIAHHEAGIGDETAAYLFDFFSHTLVRKLRLKIRT